MLTTAQPARRHREPDDIRAALVDAGVELLREHGLAVGLRGVSIDTASVAAGVSRASSYRAWKNDSPSAATPQARFHAAVSIEVLSKLLADQPLVVAAVFDFLHDAARSDDPDELAAFIASRPHGERATLFARVVATATSAAIDSLGSDSLWHTQIALVASLRSHDHADDDMVEALRRGEENAATHYVEIYRFVLNMFGIRVKPHYRYEHFALAVAALTESLTLRRGLELTNSLSRPGDSDSDTWNLFGVATMGLVKEFCEADPDAAFQTDPSAC